MTRRTERVAEAIRRIASQIIHDELKDPRIAGIITVTRVDVTPDLRLAKIYYTVLGDDKKRKIVSKGLKSARNFIRKYISDQLGLRYAPDILLKIDEKAIYRERIDSILKTIQEEGKDESAKKRRKID